MKLLIAIASLPCALLWGCSRGVEIREPPKTHDSGSSDSPTDHSEEIDDAPSACDGITHPALVINEIVASNLNGAMDASGARPDWIEIANLDPEPLSLDGWGLAAEQSDPFAWTFPPILLAPGGLLLVWASGEDRHGDPAAGEENHASFTLEASDPQIRLSAPDRCTVDEPRPGRLYGDISYGRTLADPANWGFFLEPTPGLPNKTESRPGFAETPALSPGGGFTESAIRVSATSAQSGARVRVTLDGRAPGEEDPEISLAFAVDATSHPVVVRARAWVDGLWPSRVATSTYSQDPGILEDRLSVVSLVVDPFDLWDEKTGIYAYGPPDYETSYPYFGANFWEDWERELHVEVWDAEGDRVIDQDAGIKIHGGYTRAFNQKSFRLMARSAYGPERFEHRFFPFEDSDSFENIILEGAGDWCPVHLENAFVDAVFRDPERRRLPAIDTQAWEPAVVYLNGAFWGLYAFREKLDEHYIQDLHGEDPENLDRVELGWTSEPNWELDQGSWEAFDAMNTFVAGSDLSDPAAWETFQGMADIESLAMTVLAVGYWGNSDWWGNNLRLWRPRREGGVFRWMTYDLGHGWTDVRYDHIGTSVGYSGWGLPIADALENEAFRVLLANSASDCLNTGLAVEPAMERLEEMLARIEPLIPEQYERWCGESFEYWENNADYARTWTRQRPNYLWSDFTEHLELEGVVTLNLVADPPEAGSFQLTAVEVEAPFEGQFFKGIPVTVTALPAEGWSFVGWSEAVAGEEARAVFELDGDLSLTAWFE